MSIWGRIFAAGYDHFMSGPEKATLHAHREALIAEAVGRVLEIGGGTGANLPFYGEGVEALTLTEPEPPMVRRLERALGRQGSAATVLRAPAEDLPFEDDSFGAAGFSITQLEHDSMRKVPPLVRPLVVGAAEANGGSPR